MPREKIQFENDAGATLAGYIDRPSSEPIAFALFAHCFTCTKNLRAVGNIAKSLNDAGIAVLRFDFTGLGESEGDFSDTSFSSNLSDLIAAARYLEHEHQAPALLIGHSLGGTAVLQAAFDVPSARAVATIGSPSTPAHVAHLLKESRSTIESDGEAEVNLGGRPFTIRKQFLDDLDRHPMPAAIGKLRKALLVMHAPLDDTVEIDNASELFQAARHPKSFVSLDNADHLLTSNEDSRYAGRVLAAWASRYLPQHDEKSVPHSSDVIATTRRGSFYTEVNAAGYPLIADEPVSYGGTELGPTPYDLLSAALATCTTMTLRMYADRKKLDYNSFTVAVNHSKIHAEDCQDCETSDGKIDEFRRKLTIDGKLEPAVQERILEIADRCPVHRTLHSEIKVRTELAT